MEDSQLDPAADFGDHGFVLTQLDEPANTQLEEDLDLAAPARKKARTNQERDSIKWLETPSGEEIPFVLKYGTNTVYCGTVVMERVKASNGKTTVVCQSGCRCHCKNTCTFCKDTCKCLCHLLQSFYNDRDGL